MYYTTTHFTPVGLVTLACDGENLVGLWLEGQKYHGGGISDPTIGKDDVPVLVDAKKWLDSYFAGEKPEIARLPLAPIGSAFRRQVWRLLCGIPYGQVVTYGDIAKKVVADMGRESMSGQAIGGAVGHNPLSIIIPCHRVVGGNGSLTGYAGGIDAKRKLLEWEGVDLSPFFVPKKGTAL